MTETAPLSNKIIITTRNPELWRESIMRIEGLPLIEHLQKRNPESFNKLAFSAVTLFSKSYRLEEDKTIEFDILGLTGLAKTLMREDICNLLAPIGPTYTHDYEISIALATLQGAIKNPSGKRTDEEFMEANRVDNSLMSLFVQKIHGSKFLVREKPGITQDPITRVGSSRGDWDFDRKFRSKRTIYNIIVGGDEEFRRGNITRRAILANKNNESDWASGHKAYIQHHRAVEQQIYTLANSEEGLFSSVLGKYKDMSIEDIGSYLYRMNGAMVEFERDVIRPRVSTFLHGSLNSEKVLFFQNELKGDWREVFGGYSKVSLNSKLGIHRALWLFSQQTGDSDLEQKLKEMKVPELIEMEVR